MSSAIRKPKKDAASAVESDLEFAELAAAVAKLNYVFRRIAQRREGRGTKKHRPLPDFARVKVVASPDEFAELAGEEGIVLGGGAVSGNGHTYTVLVPSSGETYYLLGQALEFTGRVMRESEVYSKESVRVHVDPESGNGHIVGQRRKSRG
jgi:hypothetical protein